MPQYCHVFWKKTNQANEKKLAHSLLNHIGNHAHSSLSHATGMVAIAVSDVWPVGVDVESIRHDDAYTDIPENFFADPEISWLQQEPSGSQAWNKKFTQLWCMKEAVLKATGQGFSIDSRCFAMYPDTLSMLTKGPDGSNPDQWFFYLDQIEEWQLAIAVKVEAKSPLPPFFKGGIFSITPL